MCHRTPSEDLRTGALVRPGEHPARRKRRTSNGLRWPTGKRNATAAVFPRPYKRRVFPEADYREAVSGRTKACGWTLKAKPKCLRTLSEDLRRAERLSAEREHPPRRQPHAQ
jgi:hypothetical protein